MCFQCVCRAHTPTSTLSIPSCGEREGKRMGKRKQFSREVILEWNQWYRHSSGPSGMTLFLLRSHWPRAAVECTVCKALGAHKVTIVHVCRKEPLPERTAITLSPSLYCFPLSLYSSSTFSGTFYFPQFFYACLKSFVLLFSFTTSPNNPPSHGLCFISFLFCLSVSLGT